MDAPISPDAVPREAARALSQRQQNNAALMAEMRRGLARRQRELPSRLLDERGVADVRRKIETLRDERWQLVEMPLVRSVMAELRAKRAVRRVVEIAPAGSSSLLTMLDTPADYPPMMCYLAVHPSRDLAMEAVQRVTNTFPDLAAVPIVTDLVLPLPIRPAPGTDFVCLGRALSQLRPVYAIRMLRETRNAMTPDDRLLISLDLRDAETRVATSMVDATLLGQWHRYGLAVTNRVLGADFPLDRFRYCSSIDADNRWIEECVQCTSAARVSVPGMDALLVRAGERIRTGVECLYDQAALQSMLRGVGLALERWSVSHDGTHALASATLQYRNDSLS